MSLDYARRHDLIDPLFEGSARPPDHVVCANCYLPPEIHGVEHYAPVAEDSVCLWPCRHEVQQGDWACRAATCVTEEPDGDGRPW